MSASRGSRSRLIERIVRQRRGEHLEWGAVPFIPAPTAAST